MGFNTPHGLGRSEQVYAKTETTAGTWIKGTSADAVKVRKCDMSVDIERKNRMDKRQSRSLLERITGKGVVNWAIESYLLPSGAAGTPPDIHPLLKALFGAYANSPATSDTYTPAAIQAMETMTLLRRAGAIVGEQVTGAMVEQGTLTIAGADDPIVRFEGPGMGHIHTGYGTCNGAPVGAVVTVQTGEGIYFDVNSLIIVGTDDNSGAGWQIISKVGDALTLEGSPTAIDDDPVAPFTPAETTAGSPVPGILGSLVIDSEALVITNFDQIIKNNFKVLDDHAFEQFPSDAIPGFRDVTGTIGCRARRDFVKYLAERKQFSAQDIAVQCGTAAGKILTVNMPTAEFNFAPLEIPESDEATISLPYVALGASGEDETEWIFT